MSEPFGVAQMVNIASRPAKDCNLTRSKTSHDLGDDAEGTFIGRGPMQDRNENGPILKYGWETGLE